MPEDFYPFIDAAPEPDGDQRPDDEVRYATRIAVYDDMLSTPRVMVVNPASIRPYLDEITNTVYRTMKEQGGHLSLMVIRELVENYIHARFREPIISILDGGDTVRFADQGPGIEDKELAFEFGVTSADADQKRYIRGTGAGLPMVEQYLENAGGVISIEDNLNQGTVVTVTVDPARAVDVAGSVSRGAVVRGRSIANPPQPAPGPDPLYGCQTPAVPGAPSAGSLPTQTMTYPQSHHGFSTAPQSTVPPQDTVQPTRAAMQANQRKQPFADRIHVSERGVLALHYIAENGCAGPTELANAYGGSTPTWSRELATLSNTGLVVKQGQKRILTDLGRLWFDQQ